MAVFNSRCFRSVIHCALAESVLVLKIVISKSFPVILIDSIAPLLRLSPLVSPPFSPFIRSVHCVGLAVIKTVIKADMAEGGLRIAWIGKQPYLQEGEATTREEGGGSARSLSDTRTYKGMLVSNRTHTYTHSTHTYWMREWGPLVSLGMAGESPKTGDRRGKEGIRTFESFPVGKKSPYLLKFSQWSREIILILIGPIRIFN